MAFLYSLSSLFVIRPALYLQATTTGYVYKLSLPNFGEAGYWLELRRRGDYQSFVP